MKCIKECRKSNSPCVRKDCRLWIDYKKDLNCTLQAVDKNGPLTLREVADRLGVSFVRIKQIEDVALRKLGKITEKDTN
tara:strand:- start:2298 stop:2534 length:237 start_codon:yes stop_codon:yes gene_type:complete